MFVLAWLWVTDDSTIHHHEYIMMFRGVFVGLMHHLLEYQRWSRQTAVIRSFTFNVSKSTTVGLYYEYIHMDISCIRSNRLCYTYIHNCIRPHSGTLA